MPLYSGEASEDLLLLALEIEGNNLDPDHEHLGHQTLHLEHPNIPLYYEHQAQHQEHPDHAHEHLNFIFTSTSYVSQSRGSKSPIWNQAKRSWGLWFPVNYLYLCWLSKLKEVRAKPISTAKSYSPFSIWGGESYLVTL